MNTTRRSAFLPGHRRNCNCDGCRPLKNAWERHRHRQIGYGTWQPYTDAEPVRAHLRDLMAAGATLRSIAAAAELDYGHVGRILWGSNGQTRKRIDPDGAARLLAVTLNQVGISDNTIVDPTGTLRRLQALHALGRPFSQIARDLGRSTSSVLHIVEGRDRITAGFAALVAARYDELKTRKPEDDGVPRRYAEESRARAAERGWWPPEAWDADIDDPNAISNLDTRRRKQSTDEQRAFRQTQQEEARLLTARGYTAQAIADYLGVSERTIVRWRVAGDWTAAA